MLLKLIVLNYFIYQKSYNFPYAKDLVCIIKIKHDVQKYFIVCISKCNVAYFVFALLDMQQAALQIYYAKSQVIKTIENSVQNKI